jgi:hypothetical protein
MVVSIAAYGYRLILSRPLSDIARTSDRVQQIHNCTQDGTRFVKFGEELQNFVISNQEAFLGIRSIHSYNSLSSRNYAELIRALNGSSPSMFGRFFGALEEPESLRSPLLSDCGVGVIVTARSLPECEYPLLASSDIVRVYRPFLPAILHQQLYGFTPGAGNCVYVPSPIYKQPYMGSALSASCDDWKRYDVTPVAAPSLLFLSQQYHPSWKAHAGRTPLQTVLVNDFFQGVIVPPHTKEVILEFRPWALWSWVSQVVYGCIGIVCLNVWLVGRRGPTDRPCRQDHGKRSNGYRRAYAWSPS